MKIRFKSDGDAISHLRSAGISPVGGVFQLRKSVSYGRVVIAAIAYLCFEWDYTVDWV